MKVTYNVSKGGHMFRILVTHIPLENLTRDDKYLILDVYSEKLILNVKIPIHLQRFLKYNKSISGRGFSFKKDKNTKLYRLSYKAETKIVLRNINKDYFKVKDRLSKGIKVYVKLKVTKEEIIKIRDRAISSNKVSNEKKRLKKIVKEKEALEKKRKYQKKAEELERWLETHMTSKNRKEDINKAELRKKGIKSYDSEVKKRCDNCIYFLGAKCIFHNVIVTKNHGCFKFRPYKTVSGGGFSPR